MTLVWGCLVTCISLNVVLYFFWKYFQSVFLYTCISMLLWTTHGVPALVRGHGLYIFQSLLFQDACIEINLTNCSIRVLWTYNKKIMVLKHCSFFSILASVITLRINENISIELLLFTLIQIHLPSYKRITLTLIGYISILITERISIL